jgi:very-short-patch-repair endonuclease
MTLPEVLLVLVAVYHMVFAPQPKLGPRPKKHRHPLNIRGSLPRRALHLRYRTPSQEQRDRAHRFRTQNIEQTRFAQPTLALVAALTSLCIQFRQEEIIWYDGDKFVIVDFWLPNVRRGIEQDGSQHRLQQRYDMQKDEMIFHVTGFRIFRKENAWFLRPNLTERLIEILQ